MTVYEKQGELIRETAKTLILDYMKKSPDCHPDGEGIKQAQLFRACGLDWGDQFNAPSSQQQYWIVALLRVLETEGLVERTEKSGPWRLRFLK